jgi:hypothetical protein
MNAEVEWPFRLNAQKPSAHEPRQSIGLFDDLVTTRWGGTRTR